MGKKLMLGYDHYGFFYMEETLMKLSKAQLLLAAGLAVSATTALADPVMPGFYIGANSGSSFVTNQSNAHVLLINNAEDGDRVSVTHREESSIRGFNGGVFAGWNFFCNETWFHGIEFSADFFSNRGRWTHDTYFVTHLDQDDVNARVANFENVYDLDYALNLTFRPGVKINDSTVFYGILGVSWACFDNEVNRINRRGGRSGGGEQEAPSAMRVSHNNYGEPVNKKEDDDNLFGFVLGAGLSKQVTHYMSVFGSYQYTYYGKTDLDGFESQMQHPQGEADPTDITVSERSATIDSNIFKIGVIFNF